MKLSQAFNQPERTAQLDSLEQALDALKQQKRHLNKGNDQIFQTAQTLTMLEMVLRRAEVYNRGPLPADSGGAGNVAIQRQKLLDQKVEMARNIVADEKQFATAIAAAFGDPKKAQEQFPDSATTKVCKPGVIDQQISQINALIDNGSLRNTVKRVAWQAGRIFSKN